MPFLSLFCIYIDIFPTYLHTWWDIYWKSMACQQMACDNDLWCYFLPLVSWPKPFFKVKFRADWNTQIPAQVQAVYLVFTFVVKRSHLLSKSLSASANLLMCRKQHKKESQKAVLPDFFKHLPPFLLSAPLPTYGTLRTFCIPTSTILPPPTYALGVADQSV